MFFIPFPLLGSSVAEQVTVNHLVVGSTPTRAAIFLNGDFLRSVNKLGEMRNRDIPMLQRKGRTDY